MPVRPDVLLLIGTSKGMFLLDASGQLKNPIANGASVPAVAYDPRRRRILAGKTSFFWGTGVTYSDDVGQTWTEPEAPNVRFPDDIDATIKQAWQVAPGTASEPDVIYVGVEPAALFRSTDGGQTFEIVRGLWDHPHRPTWQPGGGGLCLHTVLVDERDPKQLTVAISTGGVYRSDDAGESWRASNKGIRADFMPEDQRYPDYGQCVHKVARDAANPDTLFLQNHGGLYRSDDYAATWNDIGNGVPSDFGFPMVAHPHTSGTAYCIPNGDAFNRWTPEARCRVYRTSNGGQSWEALECGLPQRDAYITVLRDAFTSDRQDPAGLYFGTRSGELYASNDDGDHWELLVEHLPPILTVRAADLG
ncbi:MAG TPA: exo-alpha-sialidase [Chloroflexota bacterium]|nr:exo-alpha-sialidase [Chloroflexota bacterium]